MHRTSQRFGSVVAALFVAGSFLSSLGVPIAAASNAAATSNTRASAKLGHAPATGAIHTGVYLGPHLGSSVINLNFGLPLRNQGALDALISSQAATHQYLSRAALRSRFSPSTAEFSSLRNWLTSKGLKITYASDDRSEIAASATTSRIESVFGVHINNYKAPAGYTYYSNTRVPSVPLTLGLQSISGFSNFTRFHNDLMSLKQAREVQTLARSQAKIRKEVRTNGYFPSDFKTLYDVAGHGTDGTGQTIGYTLWSAGVNQAAMTAFATNTGDTPITLDTTNGVALGGTTGTCSGTVASGPNAGIPCNQVQEGANQLLYVLESGNPNTDYTGGTPEQSMDIQESHGLATNAGMKYYLAQSDGAGGVSNADLEVAISDAANDPTLHAISNSWGGPDTNNNQDPFYLSTNNSFQLAAAAGTTFYFSSGDEGSADDGYPNTSPWVVTVGGTELFSTGTGTTPGNYSSEVDWGTDNSGGAGSFCSSWIPRPAWQTGIGNSASCPNRTDPDIAMDADPTTGVNIRTQRNLAGTVGTTNNEGGTSLAAPLATGLAVDTLNFIKNQTYPGATPPMGFAAPTIYALGSGAHYKSYFNDVQCGNDGIASENGTNGTIGGADGDAATPGWDQASGFGSIDWFKYATGYAMSLGAQGLSVPSAATPNYAWGCQRTPTGEQIKGISCGSTSVCYGVGTTTAGSFEPWLLNFYLTGSNQLQTATQQIAVKSTNGGATWSPDNADMLADACTGPTACVEVGDGGRIRRTTDGVTWTDVPSPAFKALMAISCAPSSNVCYAAGDAGLMVKTTDAGATWTYLSSGDGNGFLGISCPTTSTCFAPDIAGMIDVTTDGGATWTQQDTPVFDADTMVLTGISCTDVNTCVVVGADPAGTAAPILVTTNGGTTWTLQTSGTGSRLWGVSCAPGTQTCYAVGAGGIILSTTNLTSWAPATSGTTTLLKNVTCLDASDCFAAGSAGTIDKLSGGVWTPTTGLGAPSYLEGIACTSTTACWTVGQQAMTLGTTDGSTWAKQAGGGTTQTMNGLSCSSATECVAVGNAGTIIRTLDGGVTWNPQTSGTALALTGVSCATNSACVTVGPGVNTSATVTGRSWSAGVATLTFAAQTIAPTVGQTITVSGINPSGYNGSFTITASSTTSVSYALASDPGSSVVITVTGATFSTGTGRATLTFAAQPTAPPVGASVTVAGINPAGYNGTFTITNSSTTTLQYTVTPNPGTFVSGGTATLAPYGGTAAYASAQAFVGFSSNADNSSASTWSPQTSNTGFGTANNLTSVSCVSNATVVCAAGDSNGGVIANTDVAGSGSWALTSTGAITALNAITCPGGANSVSVTCFAAGVGGRVVATTNSGSSWATQTSNTSNALSGIACVDASNCFAGGTLGTVVSTTNGGATWTQQGDPLSGPLSALGDTASNTGLAAATCTSALCYMGSTQGEIMASAVLTVTVTASGAFGTTPNLSGLAPNNAAISYSPSSEAPNVGGTLTCSTTATNSSSVGVYPVSSCSGLTDPNFSIVYNTAGSSYTVTQYNPMLSWSNPADITYGTALSGAQLDATADVAGTFAYSPPSGTVLHAGTSQSLSATFTPSDTTDYTSGGMVSASINVNKASLTITAGNGSSVYGSTPGSVSASYSGFVNGDSAGSLSTTPSCSTTATSASHVGSYATSCSGAASSDYSISYMAGTWNVTKAPLTITASSGSGVYGNAPGAITASYSGFVNGDNAGSLSTAPTCSTTATSASHVGSYPTSCSGAVDGNYSISYVNGSWTVTQRALSISADNQTGMVNDVEPAFTFTTSGLVNGDSLTTAPTCTAPTVQTYTNASNPGVFYIRSLHGSYAIHCSGAAASSDYSSPTYTNGTLTVTAGLTKEAYGGPISIKIKKTVKVSGNLLSTPSGTFAFAQYEIAGQPLTITLSRGSLSQSCTAKTGPYGNATCKMPVIESKGIGTVTVSYGGNLDYQASSVTQQVKFTK